MEISGQERECTYTEVMFESFGETVDYLKQETDASESKFCLVDVDGTLFTNNVLKLPILCHLASTTIPEDIRCSFGSLISNVFAEDNIAVITNRNNFERVFWNSDKILKNIKELSEVPLFTSLNRQIPGLNKRDCDNLLSKVIEYVQDKDDLKLYSIEDYSIVSPFRNHFLEYIARKVRNECGIDVKVVNLVIKR